MKIKMFVLLLNLLSHRIISQSNFSEIQMKETFDDIFYIWNIDYSKNLAPDEISEVNTDNYILYNDPYSLPANTDLPNILGDQWCGMMEGLLNMFEVTKDKGYLIKFINMSNYMMSKRYDILSNNSNYTPRWSPICFLNTDCNIESIAQNGDINKRYNDYPVYQDGVIMYSLARFCYMVKVKYPNLNNFPLQQSTNYNGISRLIINTYNLPGININYMGDYATWLAAKVSETIQWYYNNGYYKPEDGDEDTEVGFYKKQVYASGTQCLEFNKQAGFMSACLYIGAIYNNEWLDIGAQIARKIRNGKHKIKQQHESCNWPINCCYRYRDILFEDSQADALLWWHGAYHKLDICDEQDQPKEDLGHAFNSMNVFRTCYDVNLFTNGNYLFDDATMTKFRNLFVNRITLGNGIYSNAIDGTNGPIWHDGSTNSDADLNEYRFHAPAFMYFYKWDDSQKTLYNDLMNFYNTAYTGTGASNFSAGNNAYLSYYVKAQWDYECPNLTLRNRFLSYNQNFYSKNNLIIDPSLKKPLCEEEKAYGVNYFPLGKNDPRSFFDPIIIEPNFTVNANVVCNMQAANEIVFKPGFEVKNGAEFTAIINPVLCSPGIPNANRIATSENSSNEEKLDKITYINNEIKIKNLNSIKEIENSNSEIETSFNLQETFLLHPNPASSSIFVLSLDKPINQVQIKDVCGKIIYSDSNINVKRKEISIQDYSSGIYLINVSNEINTKVFKLLKN